MFEPVHLAAIMELNGRFHVVKIPLHQDLQRLLTASWQEQLYLFITDIDEVDFDAGYKPDSHERFRLNAFTLPGWLQGMNSQMVRTLESIQRGNFDAIKSIAAFTRLENGNELIMFQNFNHSNIIIPGSFLFLAHDYYEAMPHPGFSLDNKLSAVYTQHDGKLLFHNFRATNIFLPLSDFYRESSEQDIRAILAHNLFAPRDADALAVGASQWFRKRFAMLNDSHILDNYTAQDILHRSDGYAIHIELENERVVFPSDKASAKRLLQFLNEELFKGAITETLYETNSKRESS